MRQNDFVHRTSETLLSRNVRMMQTFSLLLAPGYEAYHSQHDSVVRPPAARVLETAQANRRNSSNSESSTLNWQRSLRPQNLDDIETVGPFCTEGNFALCVSSPTDTVMDSKRESDFFSARFPCVCVKLCVFCLVWLSLSRRSVLSVFRGRSLRREPYLSAWP